MPGTGHGGYFGGGSFIVFLILILLVAGTPHHGYDS